MRRILTGFVLSFIISLLCSCSEKTNEVKTELEEANESKDIFVEIVANGVNSLYVKYLPDLNPCVVVLNLYNEVTIYYDEEYEMIWVNVPLVGESKDWEFTINGKDVKGHDHNKGQIFAMIENDKVTVERVTHEQLLERGGNKNEKASDSDSISCIGYGVKFDEADVVKIKGMSHNHNATQYFTIDYNPDEGWKYQSDAPVMQSDIIKADVFGFSKQNMLEQFRTVFKKKKECILRFNRPHSYSKLIRFTYVEYVMGVDDQDFADLGNIIVGADFIRVDGENLSDLDSLKWTLREKLKQMMVYQMSGEKFYPYMIDLHEDCSNEYLRALLEELDHGDMSRFKLRIIPNK